MYLLLAIFANYWIYKITLANFILGVLVILTSILLYNNSKYFLYTFLVLLTFQVTTTQKNSLTNIANDDRRVIDMRLRAYPAPVLRIGYWLEERRESIAINRITKNLFENLDFNLYFFANHPRQRVGITEIEKFHFVFLPFFLSGIIILVKTNQWLKLSFSFLIPLIVLSFIGNQNILGPFSTFPFFAVCIANGLKKFFG